MHSALQKLHKCCFIKPFTSKPTRENELHSKKFQKNTRSDIKIQNIESIVSSVIIESVEMIETIESIGSFESIDSIDSIDSIESIDSIGNITMLQI